MGIENVKKPVLQKKVSSGFPYFLLVIFALRIFILTRQITIYSTEPIDVLDGFARGFFVEVGAFILSISGIIFGLKVLKQKRAQFFTAIVIVFSTLTLFPEFIDRAIKVLLP